MCDLNVRGVTQIYSQSKRFKGSVAALPKHLRLSYYVAKRQKFGFLMAIP